jgi:hypothetical protein
MFWTVTLNRLAESVATALPKTYGARPDLAKGQRLLAVATEGGIVLTLSGPPPRQAGAMTGPVTPRYRSTVTAPAS